MDPLAAPPLDPDALAAEVRRRHAAHTVILYGSRVRGDATPRSDVDVVALREGGGRVRDLEPWHGLALDVHVHPDADLAAVVEAHAPGLRDARVLVERDDAGRRVIAAAHARLAGPPKALAVGERAALWAWGDKMRARVAHPDPAFAAFHRATLLVESLGSWAEVRGRWFFGGKAALGALAADDPAMLAAWRAAAAPGADVAAFHRLLDAVFPAALRPAETSGPAT